MKKKEVEKGEATVAAKEAKDIHDTSSLVDVRAKKAEEEAMAVGEFTGMIAHYVSQEEGGSIDAFEVVIVPQNDDQSKAVKDIIPNIWVIKLENNKVINLTGGDDGEEYEKVCEEEA